MTDGQHLQLLSAPSCGATAERQLPTTIRAKLIAAALGGGRGGSGWMARCPAHEDRKPSLAICENDGKVLVHCHAGCSQAQVVAALRSLGLWSEPQGRLIRKQAGNASKSRYNGHKGTHTAAALAIWKAASASGATLVETYLVSRGLKLPPPSALRFHPGLRHPSGGIWPAMVALVTRGLDDAPLAIHRTFLARNGAGKAPVSPQRMMLGPCRGGAVRLGLPTTGLMVGEGIETCLAAMLATGHPAWAALSTSGLCALHLPATVREVMVLADGDDPGESAARDSALRWKREGRRVWIARPPRGLDFNDMLTGRLPPTAEGAP